MKENAAEAISERFYYVLDVIREREGMTTADMARVLGIRRPGLYRCRAAGVVRLEWFPILCLSFGTSADWLLTGRGPMFSRRRRAK